MNKLTQLDLAGLSAVEEWREITKVNHPDIPLSYALLQLGIAGVISSKQVKEILDNPDSDYQRFAGCAFVDHENKARLYSWFAMDEDALLMFNLIYKSHIVITLSTEEMILKILTHTGRGTGRDPIITYTREITIDAEKIHN